MKRRGAPYRYLSQTPCRLDLNRADQRPAGEQCATTTGQTAKTAAKSGPKSAGNASFAPPSEG
jgi:hypothetical protein